MAHVEKIEKSGRYKAVRSVDGKRVCRNFPTEAEAHAWLGGRELVPAIGAAVPRHRVPTVAQFVGGTYDALTDKWAWRRDDGGYATDHLRPNTIRSYDVMMRNWILPQWGTVRLDEITHAEAQAWVREKVAPGRAPTTVRQVKMLLQRVLDSAITHGYLKDNVAAKIRTPQAVHVEMRFLNEAEVKRLEAAFPERYKAFVPLAVDSGLRLGELLGLRWRYVDLYAGLVRVVETISTHGKGRREVGQPKTRHGRRSVPISPWVVSILADYRRAAERDVGRVEPDDYVFTAADDGRTIDAANFRMRVWRPAVIAAGLEPLRIHDLRHTAIALWIAAGLTPQEVKQDAGHANAAFSLDRYGHLYPDSADKRAAAKQRLWAAAG